MVQGGLVNHWLLIYIYISCTYYVRVLHLVGFVLLCG